MALAPSTRGSPFALVDVVRVFHGRARRGACPRHGPRSFSLSGTLGLDCIVGCTTVRRLQKMRTARSARQGLQYGVICHSVWYVLSVRSPDVCVLGRRIESRSYLGLSPLWAVRNSGCTRCRSYTRGVRVAGEATAGRSSGPGSARRRCCPRWSRAPASSPNIPGYSGWGPGWSGRS